MIGLKNGLAPRSTSQPAHGAHGSASPNANDTINNSKRKSIIMSVKKRFEDKFGTKASPAIDKYLGELNKKDKVTIHVSYSANFQKYSIKFCDLCQIMLTSLLIPFLLFRTLMILKSRLSRRWSSSSTTNNNPKNSPPISTKRNKKCCLLDLQIIIQ